MLAQRTSVSAVPEGAAMAFLGVCWSNEESTISGSRLQIADKPTGVVVSSQSLLERHKVKGSRYKDDKHAFEPLVLVA